MPRPRDENGNILALAHQRLDMRPFHQAALFAMDADPRSPALPISRKLAMIDKAVDHVIDGEKPPAWVFGTDSSRPHERFLGDLWITAVRQIQRIRAAGQNV